jgi:hypothetical protein
MQACHLLCNKFQGQDKSPIIQYKALLAEKKHVAVEARRKENEYEQLVHSGFVLKIALKCYASFEDPRNEKDELRVWRRFRVSGGISLSALHDRILQPVMGWSRGYHSHNFCDLRDGACFGPTERRFLDDMHR